ncbi:transcriptional repressor AgaR [Dongshaea marina]|uniref:transcriptional repressor AgaR n=1 Tax=Dongshaea marina TaxID=2047966 RepID=UPI000D3E67E2|nr:transcriptional repressor AgaR [Dongshaea marina]
MANTVERREQIVEQILEQGVVRVEDLSRQFSVSSVTIRNDLSYLEKRGCLVRSYGGAMINHHFAFDRPLRDKGRLNRDQKMMIAACAASLIEDGDSLIIDSGTTTSHMTHYLADKRELVVMTNSLGVAYELAGLDSLEVMVAGGSLRHNSYSLYGPAAEQNLRNYRFDKLFLGVDGFDLKAGITTPHQGEAGLNRVMCEVASEVIAVTDSSKFGRKSFCMIREAGQIDKLITDNQIPQLYLQALTQMGVEVLIADQD